MQKSPALSLQRERQPPGKQERNFYRVAIPASLAEKPQGLPTNAASRMPSMDATSRHVSQYSWYQQLILAVRGHASNQDQQQEMHPGRQAISLQYRMLSRVPPLEVFATLPSSAHDQHRDRAANPPRQRHEQVLATRSPAHLLARVLANSHASSLLER